MRWASLLFCCVSLAFTLAGASAPLLATDLKSPRPTYPDERRQSENALAERRVAEFCGWQGRICRKICDLRSRFQDRFDGCPQSCESRAIRCIGTTCYRWSESEFLVAERFGGFHCVD